MVLIYHTYSFLGLWEKTVEKALDLRVNIVEAFYMTFSWLDLFLV
jgi:hypothetical protein